MRRLLVLALLAATPGLAGAKAPWAEIDGSFANPAHADEVDVLIRSVNDRRFDPMRSKVEIKPGPQWVTVATTRPSGGASFTKTRPAKATTVTTMPYVFKAEPCLRYMLAAKHEGLSEQRFTVIVVAVERIGECTLPPGTAEPTPSPAPAADPAPAPAAVAPTGPSEPAEPADDAGGQAS